jgi:HSP20 family protein
MAPLDLGQSAPWRRLASAGGVPILKPKAHKEMRAAFARGGHMANLLTRRRTDPFAPLFGDWMDDFWNRTHLLPMPRQAEMPAMERALMDIVDKGEAFEVKVDMPGVKKEDIDVSVEGTRVSIRAETQSTKEEKEGERILHTERFAAMYARTFELPVEVTETGADAHYEDGVLTLTLPKRAPLATKKLTIN